MIGFGGTQVLKDDDDEGEECEEAEEFINPTDHANSYKAHDVEDEVEDRDEELLIELKVHMLLAPKVLKSKKLRVYASVSCFISNLNTYFILYMT